MVAVLGQNGPNFLDVLLHLKSLVEWQLRHVLAKSFTTRRLLVCLVVLDQFEELIGE